MTKVHKKHPLSIILSLRQGSEVHITLRTVYTSSDSLRMTISCNNSITRTSYELLFRNGSVFFSAFLLCFSLSLAADINVISDPVLAAVGDDVTLNISIGRSALSCTWYRGAVQSSNVILQVENGVQTEGPKYTNRESILQPSRSLRIANATLEDNGTYWVLIIFNTSPLHDQSSVTLKVLVLEKENLSKRLANATLSSESESEIDGNNT
ncbi:uncharacterized protein LOC122808424 [Protopterus annectens]|uniref:uncharacterized protein LOC122808424 n=1 Tax=Protopterus annectens TaxID=7888 RepID=UPI001CFA2A43|nr:uncharacterized protein LOC122808424 [Protopterus annectens]